MYIYIYIYIREREVQNLIEHHLNKTIKNPGNFKDRDRGA